MRTVMSTIGTQLYRISKCLVRVTQHRYNTHRVINSAAFVDEAEQWKITEII